MQQMLGRLFNHELNEEKVTDIHDRALFYYRLLLSGVDSVIFLFFTFFFLFFFPFFFFQNFHNRQDQLLKVHNQFQFQMMKNFQLNQRLFEFNMKKRKKKNNNYLFPSNRIFYLMNSIHFQLYMENLQNILLFNNLLMQKFQEKIQSCKFLFKFHCFIFFENF